jgi:gluconolactonase
MTRANAIWRLPLMNDGTVSKAGVFIQLSGGLGGPDGMERGLDDTVHVAHVGNGCVWSFDRSGIPTHRVMCGGEHVTNLTFSPQGRMVITVSGSGDVYRY